jgi:hypothetical protein
MIIHKNRSIIKHHELLFIHDVNATLFIRYIQILTIVSTIKVAQRLDEQHFEVEKGKKCSIGQEKVRYLVLLFSPFFSKLDDP